MLMWPLWYRKSDFPSYCVSSALLKTTELNMLSYRMLQHSLIACGKELFASNSTSRSERIIRRQKQIYLSSVSFIDPTTKWQSLPYFIYISYFFSSLLYVTYPQYFIGITQHKLYVGIDRLVNDSWWRYNLLRATSNDEF